MTEFSVGDESDGWTAIVPIGTQGIAMCLGVYFQVNDDGKQSCRIAKLIGSAAANTWIRRQRMLLRPFPIRTST
jgi:hypothetical protein